MNTHLQNAINATRAGDKKEAQLLLAQNLKENPDDAQSWYLLSMLVDSKEKQAIYLSKTLALDPTHEKANERLEIINYAAETSANITISEDEDDFIYQAEGDSLPQWLATDASSLQLNKAKPAAAEDEEENGEKEKPTKQVPQWLQENVSESWVIQEPATQVSISQPDEGQEPSSETAKAQEAQAPVPKKRRPKKVRTVKEEKSRLNLILAVLIMGLFLVFIALIVYAF